MKYSRLINFTLIAVIISDCFKYISWSGKLNVDSATYISSALIYFSILSFFLIAKKWGFVKHEIPTLVKVFFLLWLGWNVTSLIRGGIYAKDYWDWKVILLGSVSFTFISLVFFVGQNIRFSQMVFKFAIKYIFPLGFLLIPVALATNKELYSRIVISVGLFLTFLPFLKKQWRWLVLIVTIVSILVAPDFRSNIIKISFSLVLLGIYFLHKYINRGWLKLGHLLLFVTPIVLFTLAVSGKYNIFTDISGDEGFYIQEGGELERNYMADTRTGLYRDVLSSVFQSDQWLIGEGAGGKYQTERFDYLGDNRGRYSSEVGVLNIFLYHGLIGVSIYFLLLYTVSYMAISKSNNILAQLLGLYIAFRWTFSFVEEFTQYDMNFYFFWIVMGLIASRSFRMMSNEDIRKYLELKV